MNRDSKGRFKKGVHYNRATEFQKGQTAFNKGMKQEEYMSEETIERTKATRFQKGQHPASYRPIGSRRISKDGYVEIKVSDNKWRQEHCIVYEEKYGPTPRGCIIIHLNKDKLDNDIDNLMMISRAENAYMNRNNLWSTDRCLTQLCLSIAKLKLATNKKKKEKKK